MLVSSNRGLGMDKTYFTINHLKQLDELLMRHSIDTKLQEPLYIAHADFNWEEARIQITNVPRPPSFEDFVVMIMVRKLNKGDYGADEGEFDVSLPHSPSTFMSGTDLPKAILDKALTAYVIWKTRNGKH